jgi:hypothetical protein
MAIAINPERMLCHLRELAQFGAAKNGRNAGVSLIASRGLHRLAFSPDDMAARRWLAGKLAQCGLDAAIDRVGNVVARSHAPRAVLIGSHTDTVPNGGWLDGAMGVIYGIRRRDRCRRGRLPGRGRNIHAFPRQPQFLRHTAGCGSRCRRGRKRGGLGSVRRPFRQTGATLRSAKAYRLSRSPHRTGTTA